MARDEGMVPLSPAESVAIDAARAAREVPDALFRRRLGLGRAGAGAGWDERVEELAAATRAWYAEHGDPWALASVRRLGAAAGGEVVLEGGLRWRSALLAAGFREAGAGAVAVAGASAGHRADEEVARRWSDGRPDEALFLGALAAAVAEQLRAEVSRTLERALGPWGLAVLPHYSPGYEGWGLRDQAAVLAALEDPGPLRVLPSGGLAPARSTLAVFGIAPVEAVRGQLAGFWRRRRQGLEAEPVAATPPAQAGAGAALAGYAFPERALEKWSRDRLALVARADGLLEASFRFDGKICGSPGLVFGMDYGVELRQDGPGWRIASASCRPAGGDRGHESMCAWLRDPQGLERSLREERPLVGAGLEEALRWSPEACPAGCLCERSMRDHKWTVVYQTLHYAVARRTTGVAGLAPRDPRALDRGTR
ncbi:MAG: hypothetical protein HY721_16575 [Planctomycetes bacterium]|nr:hypothetical protein [Planctomycetota bacterium]